MESEDDSDIDRDTSGTEGSGASGGSVGGRSATAANKPLGKGEDTGQASAQGRSTPKGRISRKRALDKSDRGVAQGARELAHKEGKNAGSRPHGSSGRPGSTVPTKSRPKVSAKRKSPSVSRDEKDGDSGTSSSSEGGSGSRRSSSSSSDLSTRSSCSGDSGKSSSDDVVAGMGQVGDGSSSSSSSSSGSSEGSGSGSSSGSAGTAVLAPLPRAPGVPPPLPPPFPFVTGASSTSTSAPPGPLAGPPLDSPRPAMVPLLHLERSGESPFSLIQVPQSRATPLRPPRFTSSDITILVRCYGDAGGDIVAYLSSPAVVQMIDVLGYSIRDLLVLNPMIRECYELGVTGSSK